MVSEGVPLPLDSRRAVRSRYLPDSSSVRGSSSTASADVSTSQEAAIFAYTSVRHVTTTGLSSSNSALRRCTAIPHSGPESSSRPSSTGSTRWEPSSSLATVWPREAIAPNDPKPAARRSASHLWRLWRAGFHVDTGKITGTASAEPRRASMSRTITAATGAHFAAKLKPPKQKISNVAAPVTSAAATHTVRCLHQSHQRATPPPVLPRTAQTPPSPTMSPTRFLRRVYPCSRSRRGLVSS